ncbi:MAG TPA: VWA-like domain-containing protein [Bacillota bacterium]|nr:VWA-like domain-containing protein [Bacillota bacterium]HPL53921.1 VWA-like domain-containing protein [Bacillota bacterium]
MKVRDAMLHLLLKQPFYGYVAASVTSAESEDIATIKMINDSVLKLVYNKKWYESISDKKAIGVIIHELLHIILMHPYRREGREKLLWTVACDMAANEHIAADMLLEDSVTVEAIAKEIREKIPKLRSAEFYYEIISKDEGQFSFFESKDDIRVVLKSGLGLTANRQMDDETSEINKSALKSMMSEIIEQAQLEGEIPGDVGALIADIYKTGDVNWRNVLRRFLTGKGKVIKKKSYKRESTRFENLPGNKRTRGINALIALDASGSISEKQFSLFYSELMKIKKVTGAVLSVTQFDTDCTAPVPIERFTREKKRLKSGGTDYRPVFKLADSISMPLLVIFTDGEGAAPPEANQKVVWMLPKGGKKPASYGHYVDYEG